MKHMIKKEELLDGREYSLELEEYGTQLAYWNKYKDVFVLKFVGWMDTVVEYDICESITKSKMKHESILINGVEGDNTILYLDGYIDTKYGETLKIKSVDIEKGVVELYGESYDFSRISSSIPNNESGKKEYVEYIERFIENRGIRIGTKLEFKGDYQDELDRVFEVEKIEMPDCVNNFYPKIHFKDDNDRYWEINELKFIHRVVDILHTPLTIDEEVEKIISGLGDNKEVTKNVINYFIDNHGLNI